MLSGSAGTWMHRPCSWVWCRAQSHVEEVQPQGRAVDKAFKRELGPLPYYPDLLVLYQDRSRGYTYQADFQATELDEMLAAPTMVSQQQQQRMQAPVLGYNHTPSCCTSKVQPVTVC